MGAGGGEETVTLAFKPQKEFDVVDGGLGHYATLWSWSWSSLRAHVEQMQDHRFAEIYAGTGGSWRHGEGTELWSSTRAVVLL